MSTPGMVLLTSLPTCRFSPLVSLFDSSGTITTARGDLLTFCHSFATHIQFGVLTNIRRVTFEKPWFKPYISHFFTAIERILVRLQIWKQAVNERLKWHILHINYIVIQSELEYLIGAKVAKTVKWKCNLVPNWSNTTGVQQGPVCFDLPDLDLGFGSHVN